MAIVVPKKDITRALHLSTQEELLASAIAALDGRPIKVTRERLLVANIKHDPTYQRKQNEKTVLFIYQNFNPVLCDDLVCSRRSNNEDYVLDGGHRLAVMHMKGIKYWTCKVFHGLTREDEARIFLILDTARHGLTSLDRFWAALKAKEQTAVDIQAVLKEFGCHVPHNPAPADGVLVTCPQVLQQAYRAAGGASGVREILSLVCGAWDASETHRLTAGILKGAHYLLHVKSYTERNIDINRLRDKLSRTPVAAIECRAHAIAIGTNMQMGDMFAKAMLEVYFKGSKKRNGQDA